MKRFCEAFLKLEKGIGGALLLLMLVVVFFATVGRYTGLYNMSWSDEAARYLMIWFVFLLAGLSAFRGESVCRDKAGFNDCVLYIRRGLRRRPGAPPGTDPSDEPVAQAAHVVYVQQRSAGLSDSGAALHCAHLAGA